MKTRSQMRRYDPQIDRVLRSFEDEARMSDEDARRAGESLVTVAAIVAVIVAAVAAVLA